MAEKTSKIKVGNKTIHLVLGKTLSEWKNKYGNDGDLWDFPLEELLDGTIEPSENLWYWLIDGRCYETEDVVISTSKKFRITFRSEVNIEADDIDEARKKWEQIDLWSDEALNNSADFIEVVSVEDEKYNDLTEEF